MFVDVMVKDLISKSYLPWFNLRKGMRIYNLKISCFLIRNLIVTNISVKNFKEFM